MNPLSAVEDALQPGARLGAATIEALLGASETGFVYLVSDSLLMGKVAIKEYFPRGLCERGEHGEMLLRPGADEQLLAAGRSAFAEEARLLSQGALPGLLRVNLVSEENGTAYRMMPFHDAPTLADALQAGAFAGDAAAVRSLLAPLLETLRALHQQGLVHGYLHPGQVLLPAGEAPLLLGFGLVRHALQLPLDHRYAPLEQSKLGGHLPRGAWTDLYALGAIGFHAAVGEPPPSAVDRASGDAGDLRPALDRALGGQRGGSDAASALAAALDRALAVLPGDRPQSAQALSEAMAGGGAERPAASRARRAPAGPARKSEPVLAWTADPEPTAAAAAPSIAPPAPAPARQRPSPPPAAAARAEAPRRELPNLSTPARAQPQRMHAMPGLSGAGSSSPHARPRGEPAFEDPGFDRLADREAEARWARGPRAVQPAPSRAPAGLVAALWICTILLAAVGGAAGWHWLGDRQAGAQALSAATAPRPAPVATPAGPGAAPGAGLGSGTGGIAATPAGAAPTATAQGTPAAPANPEPNPAQPTAAMSLPASPQAAMQQQPPPAVQPPGPSAQNPLQAGPTPVAPAQALPPQAAQPQAPLTAGTGAPPAGRATQAPTAPEREVVVEAPSSPRQACGDRSNFSLHWCMQQQCARPQFSAHPQCRAFRATGEVR